MVKTESIHNMLLEKLISTQTKIKSYIGALNAFLN